MFTVPAVLSTNYVSVDSFDVLVDKYFVRTGLASEDILTLELDEQFGLLLVVIPRSNWKGMNTE